MGILSLSLSLSLFFSLSLFLLLPPQCLSLDTDSKPFSPSLSVFLIPPLIKNNGKLHAELQHRTVTSILRFDPPPQIFLLGNHSSFFNLKTQFSEKVEQDFEVDFTFESGVSDGHGSPLFHSIIARAMSATSAFSMVINADVAIINQTALRCLIDEASRKFSGNGFLMTWPRHAISQLPPVFSVRPSSEEDSILSDSVLSRHVEASGRLETSGGAGAWLWDNGHILYSGKMPPFPARRSELDTWLAHATLVTTKREVIDGGTAVTCGSTRHLKSRVGIEGEGSGEEGEKEDEWFSKKEKNPALVRSHLQRKKDFLESGGNSEGDDMDEVVNRGCPTRKPWILKPCSEFQDGGGMCLTELNCTCNPKRSYIESASSSLDPSSTLTVQDLERQKWVCNAVSPKPYLTTKGLTMASSPREGFTLEELLPIVADSRKVVTLVAVSGGYIDMLMNFICTLRRIGLRDPLVAALDEEMYRFASAQGLSVYLEHVLEKRSNESAREKACGYGTRCFREVTCAKPRVVLRILKLGYHVFWTDSDIAWFSDPVPEIFDLGPGTFPIQSEQYKLNRPANGAACSGFYFARSEPLVIQAMEDIIKRSLEHDDKSEQPSYFYVLCGENGEYKVGDDECVKNGLRTIFLNRTTHPNGLVHDFWDKPIEVCKEMGCVTLHNNWILGRTRKIQRFKIRNIWWWDEEARICRYNWYDNFVKIVKRK